MRKFFLLLISLFFLIPGDCFSAKKPQVVLFYKPHCGACISLKAEFLPSIKEKYKDKVNWTELNIDEPDNVALLMSVAARFKKNAFTPSMLAGDVFMVGKQEIQNSLPQAIEQLLIKPPVLFDFAKIDLHRLFDKLSLVTVIGLGLLDGINPCAFAVIVFFISFLAVYGYKKREILYVGISYCFAVFFTYLLIGLGVFKFLYELSSIHLIIRFFYYAVAGFCFFLSGCAFWDYLRFKKTGDSGDMILQLPAFLKKRINKVIGDGLRDKRERSMLDLSATAFVIGFIVSLLEAACTGQVYVPTIVFILKNTDLKLKAFSYLILYNLMFILPLILVFIFSLAGISSSKFNAFLKNNLAKIKIIMAIGFLVLGVFLLRIS